MLAERDCNWNCTASRKSNEREFVSLLEDHKGFLWKVAYLITFWKEVSFSDSLCYPSGTFSKAAEYQNYLTKYC